MLRHIASLIVCCACTHAADLQVEVTASDASGVAPLAVHFDATSIVLDGIELDPLRDVRYHWSFGDTSTPTWTTNNHTTNADSGFIAAHLYETPGVYQVTLEVTTLHGPSASTSTQLIIEVQDPDVFYADKTTCFSVENNFEDCPEGAVQVHLGSAAGEVDSGVARGYFAGGKEQTLRIWSPYKEYAQGVDHSVAFDYTTYMQGWSCLSEVAVLRDSVVSAAEVAVYARPGQRLLFRRGERFLFVASIRLDDFSGGSIAAYGSGAAPRFEMIGPGSFVDLIVIYDGQTDIKVSDLSLKHLCGDKNRALRLYGTVSRITLNRIEATEFDTGLVASTYGQEAPNDLIGLFNLNFYRMGASGGGGANETICTNPRVPDWHNGDRVTPIPEAEWLVAFDAYKTALVAVSEDVRCRNGGNVVYLPSHRHMIVGSRFYDARSKRAEHVVRIPLAHRSVIAHNIFEEPSLSKHALKLHNMGGCEARGDCARNPVQSAAYPTSLVLIRRNVFRSNSDIAVAVAPGTSRTGEKVSNVLFEFNVVEATGENNGFGVVAGGESCVFRNNKISQTHGYWSWTAVSIGQQRGETDHVRGNWVTRNDITSSERCIVARLGAESEEAVVTDNNVFSSQRPVFVDSDYHSNYSSAQNVWEN